MNPDVLLAFAICAAGAAALAFAHVWSRRARPRDTGQVAEQFERARRSKPGSVVSIGGLRWTYSAGEFHHLDEVDRWGKVIPGVGTHRESRRQAQNQSIAWRALGAILLTALPSLMTALSVSTNDSYQTDIGREALSNLDLWCSISIVGSLCIIAWELAYQKGWQWIPGAMVLDPPEQQTGEQEVREQKVHGRARLATESEALEAARGFTPSPPTFDELE